METVATFDLDVSVFEGCLFVDVESTGVSEMAFEFMRTQMKRRNSRGAHHRRNLAHWKMGSPEGKCV